MDRSFTALVNDLEERGMQSTLVIGMGVIGHRRLMRRPVGIIGLTATALRWLEVESAEDTFTVE